MTDFFYRDMALSAAEKMRRRRQKLKEEGKYEEYKENQRQQMKKVRDKKKEEISKLKKRRQEAIRLEERRKTRERVAKHRLLKKERQRSQASPCVTYKSACSSGKAIKRAKKALPKSPRKKAYVVRKLFELIPGTKDINETKKHTNSLALSSETVDKVIEFYERDDISRMSPGLKDVTTVKRIDGSKHKLQTRHLFSSIRETHALFCDENKETVIGKSKFSELRPKHVKYSSRLPHNVCLCKYHENFIFAVNALHSAFPSFPKYTQNFWDKYLCQPHTEECWLRNCDDCKNKLCKCMEKLLEENGASCDVKWHVWKELPEGLRKVVEEDSAEELVIYINSICNEFLKHSYTKREQANSYQIDRSKTASPHHDKKIALVQVDFSENYTCIAQQEIQSYHWNQPQVSLFTCSLCYEGKQYPIVIVSDNLNHSKDTIVAYMSTIFYEIPTEVSEVRVWSDGPSSQFKNKFIAASLKPLEDTHKKKIIWNYFATSHGKGPVDGIGGSVKRQVRQAVLSGKGVVYNASDFCSVAKKVSNVTVLHMSVDEIDSLNTKLDVKSIFEEADTVPGITKSHCIFWEDKSLMTYALTRKMSPPVATFPSNSKNKPQRVPIYSLIYDSDDNSSDDDVEPVGSISKVAITNGSFVLVEFSEEKNLQVKFRYVAICQSEIDEQYDVKIMCLKSVNNSKQVFKIEEDDITFVKQDQIVKVLQCPEIVMQGNRMHYKFKKNVDIKEK